MFLQDKLHRTFLGRSCKKHTTEISPISFFEIKDYIDLWYSRFFSDCVGRDLEQKHLRMV